VNRVRIIIGIALLVVAAAVVGVCAAGLFVAAPAHAQALTPATQNQACFACHGVQSAKKTMITVNGVKKSIYVNAAVYNSSLHGELDCTSCHIGFKADKHTATETSGWLEMAKLTSCSYCHASEFSMYKGSFHGTLVLKENSTKAPRCADCHDAHDTVNVASLAFRKQSLTMCGRCHPAAEASYLNEYHGQAFVLGKTQAAVCIDCHGGHKILPPSNPASTISKQNILKTCRKCHPSANANFTGYRIHINPSNPRSSPVVFLVWLAYTVLIATVFTFGGVHTVLYIYRGIKSGGYRKHHE
jgi:predicted CXXCH cytochrome family protein